MPDHASTQETSLFTDSPTSRVKDSDRVLWILMRRFLRDWKGALVFVQPDPVVRWHRKGWKYYWKRKSKPRKVGRPPISFKLITHSDGELRWIGAYLT